MDGIVLTSAELSGTRLSVIDRSPSGNPGAIIIINGGSASLTVPDRASLDSWHAALEEVRRYLDKQAAASPERVA